MQNKPKILIFIDWYKPGYKAGGPIQSISNLISQLEGMADFHVVTRNTDYLEDTPYPNITPDQWTELDNYKVFYCTKKFLSYQNIKSVIDQINPDIIYSNSLYSPYFTIVPLIIGKKRKIDNVLAVRGMLSKGSLSVKNSKKKIFLGIIRNFGLFRNLTFHATTKQEAYDIRENFGNKVNILVAKNLSKTENLIFTTKEKNIDELRMIYLGRIAPEKNVLYALETLQQVKSAVVLDVYGSIYNERYWAKCTEVINQLPSNIVVNYKGILPHTEVNQTLKKYHVIYLPSTGENYGHVIIEGMLNSCIPLISDQTPWRNLESQDIGFDIPLDNQKKFSERINQLAELTSDSFNDMSKNSYHYAYNTVTDKALLKPYFLLFNLQSLINKK